MARLLEQGRPGVDDFWSEVTEADVLVSSPLLRPECTSVIRRAAFERALSHEQAQRLIRALVAVRLEVVDSLQQFARANDLARQFQYKKAYDMQYLAVAEIAGAELVTADRELRHAAETIGVPARYLI